MNRKIKFRVWDKESKSFAPLECVFGFIVEKIEGQIFTMKSDDVFIIEQYTGLKDKNGVEIYEGDKINIHWGLGKFQERSVLYNLDLCKFTFSESDHDLLACHNKYYEVVGNIHEENL